MSIQLQLYGDFDNKTVNTDYITVCTTQTCTRYLWQGWIFCHVTLMVLVFSRKLNFGNRSWISSHSPKYNLWTCHDLIYLQVGNPPSANFTFIFSVFDHDYPKIKSILILSPQSSCCCCWLELSFKIAIYKHRKCINGGLNHNSRL